MTPLELSVAIENLLVARNPRQMKTAQAALQPGYYLRAAQLLETVSGTVLIGTGFPVTGTFETDGPVGAIALYDALHACGANPKLVCGPPLCDALHGDYDVLALTARTLADARTEALQHLDRLAPELVVAIERPGLAADGRYYNMRGMDISDRCYFFDPFMTLCDCPTIGIGDGGNECGMGNIIEVISGLDIEPAVTGCDELLIADVSNWGAYGLLAMLSQRRQIDLLSSISPLATFDYLQARGSVDGTTGARTLTEDGLDARVGSNVIRTLQGLVEQAQL